MPRLMPRLPYPPHPRHRDRGCPCAAEIDGIAVAHHRLAEIGHPPAALQIATIRPKPSVARASQLTLPPLMRVVSLALAARPHSQLLPFVSL